MRRDLAKEFPEQRNAFTYLGPACALCPENNPVILDPHHKITESL